MGSITRFNLGKIQKAYKTPYFFETGTFRGDGVAYARQFPFKKILSSEIVPEIAAAAKERFANDPVVSIFEGDSVSIFTSELPKLNGNCIFWLDAHFPGADAGLTAYDKEMEEEIRLPLATEMIKIRELRRGYKDIFIIDDLRIYEDGPYEKGNVPPDALPKTNRNIDFIFKTCSRSHKIYRSYKDEGYILLFPRSSFINRLFRVFSGSRGKEPGVYINESV